MAPPVALPKVGVPNVDLRDASQLDQLLARASTAVGIAKASARNALERSEAVETLVTWLRDPSTLETVEPNVINAVYKLLS